MLLTSQVLLWPRASSGQSTVQGHVEDPEGRPLPFVNIRAGTGVGTTSDMDGDFRLEVPAGYDSLQFTYVGFEAQRRAISGELMALQITLQPRRTNLSEVTVVAGENPAHRMIRAAVKQRDKNDPERLERFKYRSYSKFYFTVNPDSIDPSIDTLEVTTDAENGKDSVKLDSSGYYNRKFLEERHLFFMETVTQRRYLKDKRDHEEVLAQRTSGFKNPMFALLVTQFQSFSFYQDYIDLVGSEYLNPLTPRSPRRYFFSVEDTAVHGRGDTTYYIRFRPRRGKAFAALEGVLALRTPDWAIEHIRALPSDTAGIPVTVRQSYRRYGRHKWFPYQAEADLNLENLSFGDQATQGIFRRKLYQIDLQPSLNAKDIPREKVTIGDHLETQGDSLINRLRSDSLDRRSKGTYSFLDSVGEAENLDARLRFLAALSRGYLQAGPFNFALDRIVRYNSFEGWRLGLGVATNNSFSEWLTFRGFWGYGFKDETSKYGLEVETELEESSNFSWRAGLSYDLMETAGFYHPQVERGGVFGSTYRRVNIERWDRTRRYYTGVERDLINGLHLDLAGRYEERSTYGNYRYLPQDAPDDPQAPTYTYLEVEPSLRWAPGEEFAQTPVGKIRIERGYPVIWLSYVRGFPDGDRASFRYQQLKLATLYRYRTLGLGTTELKLRMGATWGRTPYQKLWTPSANALSRSDWTDRLRAPAGKYSFETMRFNEFLADRYLELHWRQDFRSLLFSTKNFKPHLEMVHRAAWGLLRRPEDHAGLATRSLRHGYFESGLEFNRLIVFDLLGMGYGLGVYYRYGAYHLPRWVNNLAVKFTFKL